MDKVSEKLFKKNTAQYVWVLSGVFLGGDFL